MKTLIAHGCSKRWLAAGMSLLAAVAAHAATKVTFTIDMATEPNGPVTAVYLSASFNGWGFQAPGSALVRSNGTSIWTNTFTITDPPGTMESCKFQDNTTGWEPLSNDRLFVLGSGTQVLPKTSWNVTYAPPNNNVTFQVDMSAQTLAGDFIPGQTVTVAGDFEGANPGHSNWDDGLTLTNNPSLPTLASNIYSGTYFVASFLPTNIAYKFRANGGWESPTSTLGNDRQATITNTTQVLPLVYYSDLVPQAPTNYVTFQVDMTAQTLFGTFLPTQTVTVSTSLTGWGDGLPLTNNPSLTSWASNIYSGTLQVVGYRPIPFQYKFRANGDWEQPVSTGGSNRVASITSSNQVLPLVYFGDNDPYDLVQSNILVTFTLHLPDGTPDNGGVPFLKGLDSVYINGDFLGWWSWNNGFGGGQTAADELIEVGSTDYYTNSFVIPQGHSIYLQYKYSVDGFDNENGPQINHQREIRSYGPTYNFPVDEWSWSLGQNSTNLLIPGTNGIVELDFGYLTIGKPSGGNYPVNWLGRPGVLLQNRASLSAGSWTDNPTTDSAMSTNWPGTGSTQFFRLKKK